MRRIVEERNAAVLKTKLEVIFSYLQYNSSFVYILLTVITV